MKESDQVKLISIDSSVLVEILNWWRSPPGYFPKLNMPELPKDCTVVSVHYAPERRCLEAVVWSSEFPFCNHGEYLERVPGLIHELETVSFEECVKRLID